MRSKIAVGILLVAAGIYGAFYVSDHQHIRGTAEAKDVAARFIERFYGEEDIPGARELVSEGYRVVETESMTRTILETTRGLLGGFLGADEGDDVTRTLNPGASGRVRIFRFPVEFVNDPEGLMLVSLVKERGDWRVEAFNINSPLITKAQARNGLVQPLEDSSQTGI